MQGEVIAVSRKGVFAVRLDSGIAVAGIVGAGEVEVGDWIAGNLETGGREEVVNQTRREPLSVDMMDWGCTRDEVLRKYELRCP